MNLLTKIQNWGDHHHPQWLDYIRIALGLTLIVNGVALATHLHDFTMMMHNAVLGTAISISLMAHTIILLHIIGGVLITIGSHTRTFCLLNLFAVITMLFVNMHHQVFVPYSIFWFATILITALVCFLVEGDGILSVEHEDNLAS